MCTTEPAQLSETPDLFGAFPRLSEPQIQALATRGERRSTQEGEVLYREGDEGYDFFVILKGRRRSSKGTRATSA